MNAAMRKSATRPNRFSRVLAKDSLQKGLLCGLPVYTASGVEIGYVESLLIDKQTSRLRYVAVMPYGTGKSTVTIPWRALFFDAALGRLVFYTYEA